MWDITVKPKPQIPGCRPTASRELSTRLAVSTLRAEPPRIKWTTIQESKIPQSLQNGFEFEFGRSPLCLLSAGRAGRSVATACGAPVLGLSRRDFSRRAQSFPDTRASAILSIATVFHYPFFFTPLIGLAKTPPHRLLASNVYSLVPPCVPRCWLIARAVLTCHDQR